MNSTNRSIAAIFTALVSAGALLVSVSGGVAFIVDLLLTFLVLKRKSLISYAFSLFPAAMAYMAVAGYSRWWIIVSLALSLALVIIYKGRLPETRQTTDIWLGTLILTVVACAVPFIFLGA